MSDKEEEEEEEEEQLETEYVSQPSPTRHRLGRSVHFANSKYREEKASDQKAFREHLPPPPAPPIYNYHYYYNTPAPAAVPAKPGLLPAVNSGAVDSAAVSGGVVDVANADLPDLAKRVVGGSANSTAQQPNRYLSSQNPAPVSHTWFHARNEAAEAGLNTKDQFMQFVFGS